MRRLFRLVFFAVLFFLVFFQWFLILRHSLSSLLLWVPVSEYVVIVGSKYFRIQEDFVYFRISDISGYQIFQDTKYFRISGISRYRIFSNTGYFWIPDISRFQIFPDSGYQIFPHFGYFFVLMLLSTMSTHGQNFSNVMHNAMHSI